MHELSRARFKELLQEVLEAQLPAEKGLIVDVLRKSISSAQREQISLAITRELIATGLGVDDEPTSRGMELEMLLDEINRPNLSI